MKEIIIFVPGVRIFWNDTLKTLQIIENTLENVVDMYVLDIPYFGIRKVDFDNKLSSVIKSLKIKYDKIYIIAHSYGAFLTVNYFNKNPTIKVDKLVLYNPAGFFTHGGIFGYYLSIFYKLFFSDVGKYITFMNTKSYWNKPVIRYIPLLKIPTSLVYSKYDTLFPVQQGYIASKLANISLMITPFSHVINKNVGSYLLEALKMCSYPKPLENIKVIDKTCSAFGFNNNYSFDEIVKYE